MLAPLRIYEAGRPELFQVSRWSPGDLVHSPDQEMERLCSATNPDQFGKAKGLAPFHCLVRCAFVCLLLFSWSLSSFFHR